MQLYKNKNILTPILLFVGQGDANYSRFVPSQSHFAPCRSTQIKVKLFDIGT